jgi:2-polyprenyl-3-methyl-5-hydroxy-6-metoxy-1,4-benzoquinol methylase
VIDVGCGDGSLLYSLQKLGYLDHFNEIWAVDLSENRLSSVKIISEEIKTVQDNAQYLTNIPDNHFDLVISTQVIEHVNDDGEMIKSLSRICSRGGNLFRYNFQETICLVFL